MGNPFPQKKRDESPTRTQAAEYVLFPGVASVGGWAVALISTAASSNDYATKLQRTLADYAAPVALLAMLLGFAVFVYRTFQLFGFLHDRRGPNRWRSDDGRSN